MKVRQLNSRKLLAMLGLACVLGAAGCKTFTSTAEDMERERRYGQESQRSFWGGAWSLFAPPVYSPVHYGGWGVCPDLFPVGAGPANARPWLANAVGGGLPRDCRFGR